MADVTVQKGSSTLAELKNLMQDQSVLVKRIRKQIKVGDKKGLGKDLLVLESSGVKVATLSRFMLLSLGEVFRMYTTQWDEFPEDFQTAWPDGPYQYIENKYGIGEQMTNMYATAWVAFFSGKYIPEEKIPKFVDLTKIPIAKMNDAARHVIKGDMNLPRWKALANEDLTRTQLNQALREGTSKPSGASIITHPIKNKNLSVTLSKGTGDIMMYFPDGSREQVGHFNLRAKNPLILKYIKRLKQMGRMKG